MTSLHLHSISVAAHTGTVKRLSDKTICMTTKQGDNGEFLHYDVHSLYGYTEAIATKKYVSQLLISSYLRIIDGIVLFYRAVLEATGKRSMVLSRSTFSGSGKYTGHWLGDNFARWSNMGDSIIGIITQLNMNYVQPTADAMIFENICLVFKSSRSSNPLLV